MAVPKRKMSRANTRTRRSAWKADLWTSRTDSSVRKFLWGPVPIGTGPHTGIS